MDYRRLLQLVMVVINGCSLIAFLKFVMQSEGTVKSSWFKLYNNHYLPNHLIKSVRAMSQVECSMQCSAEEGCESWNMYEASMSDRNCELNNATVNAESTNDVLLKKDGVIFGHRVKLSATKNEKTIDPVQKKNITYVFTNLGKEGRDGPDDTSGYVGTTLEGQVTLNAGIQMWQVPYTGTYVIESRGASGGNGSCLEGDSGVRRFYRGGLGAKLSGKFWLTNGTLLKILVGQLGTMGKYSWCFRGSGGGGGGSFVTYENNTPLVIAGGGGRGRGGDGGGGKDWRRRRRRQMSSFCYCVKAAGNLDGDPGQLGVFGSRCNSTIKNGGILCGDEGSINAGSGAGLLSNGSSSGWIHPARCFVDGGKGGTSRRLLGGGDRKFGSGNGGFGGGGATSETAGGGGGGYCGGCVWANSTHRIAGGGGSVNHGFDKQSGYGDVSEHGLVKIVFLG